MTKFLKLLTIFAITTPFPIWAEAKETYIQFLFL